MFDGDEVRESFYAHWRRNQPLLNVFPQKGVSQDFCPNCVLCTAAALDTVYLSGVSTFRVLK